MSTNIRSYIKKNFKDSNKFDIKSSIENAIKENEEITLPGLGVLFELLWKHSTNVEQDEILEKLIKTL